MMDTDTPATSFIVKDCSVSTIATGISAGSLIDFREKILTVPLASIYYHFWVARLRPHFVHSGYHNDFALWIHDVLNEPVLAEKLSILDPLRFDSLEELRNSVVEIIDKGLDEKASVAWTQRNQFFHFISSKIIVVNTLKKIEKPEELLLVIDQLSTGSIFYHFIDARRHLKTSQDDFSIWLKGFGEKYQLLVERFSLIDVSFLSLAEIKKKLSDHVHEFFRRDYGLS